MSRVKGLRAWLLAGIVTLAVAGGLVGSQTVHFSSHGTATHHRLADTPPIWPPKGL